MDVVHRLHAAPGEKARARLRQQVYGIADRRLGSGWALGRYSIADIHLFRLYWRLANSLKPSPETFPNLTAHYARMMARPAVQKAIEVESAVGYELPA
jgi:glutathione S-transferase